MKAINILTFLFLVTIVSCQKEQDGQKLGETINLPLTFVEGLGPDGFGYSVLSEEHKKDNPSARIWVKTYLPVKGIPASWRGVKKSMVPLNLRQLFYQNYKAGKITQEEFDGMIKSWEWEPNPEELSAEPIKCYVYVVSGTDKEGLAAVIIDANNNLDFSDDEPFYPKRFAMDSSMMGYSKAEVHYVQYEVLQEGRVVAKQVPMLIRRTNVIPLAYTFPQYAITQLKVKDKVHTIVLTNAGRPDYDGSKLMLVDRDTAVLKEFTNMVTQGELLSVGGLLDKVKYRNLGVNMYHETLQLEGEYAEELGYALQVGYPFQPFKTKLFNSEVPVSSLDYKGRYLFIDFWGTWCKPCVAELPELQQIYRTVNKERIEFISIAGVQSPILLEKFLKKRPLAWPQIISDNKNKLVETYNITSYPTTVLIGPDGKVVARNLRGEALEQKLAEVGVRASR